MSADLKQIYASVNDVLAVCREYIAAADEFAMTLAAIARCSAAEQALIAIVNAPHPFEPRRAAMAAPAAPQGWKLVPIEPTQEMVTAGALAHQRSPCHDFIGPMDDAYGAMLAAAPAAPSAAQEAPKP